MARFILTISDELNTWLISQAELNHRSKNRHIEHILEQARKETGGNRCAVGKNQLCQNGTHYFASSNPAMTEFCNCEMFVYGEVIR